MVVWADPRTWVFVVLLVLIGGLLWTADLMPLRDVIAAPARALRRAVERRRAARAWMREWPRLIREMRADLIETRLDEHTNWTGRTGLKARLQVSRRLRAAGLAAAPRRRLP